MATTRAAERTQSCHPLQVALQTHSGPKLPCLSYLRLSFWRRFWASTGKRQRDARNPPPRCRVGYSRRRMPSYRLAWGQTDKQAVLPLWPWGCCACNVSCPSSSLSPLFYSASRRPGTRAPLSSRGRLWRFPRPILQKMDHVFLSRRASSCVPDS
ncbi:hypothetical protein IWZ03DRAFT_391184 [Phyllosticta citriasiana]|uniref:Uncharacterized protein n=1 Tax=Phyllosticta citriasiana TaxID=595635 RepID=A0ABR1K9M5_9PEZI